MHHELFRTSLGRLYQVTLLQQQNLMMQGKHQSSNHTAEYYRLEAYQSYGDYTRKSEPFKMKIWINQYIVS